jgi:hypothetical protein
MFTALSNIAFSLVFITAGAAAAIAAAAAAAAAAPASTLASFGVAASTSTLLRALRWAALEVSQAHAPSLGPSELDREHAHVRFGFV